jgi:formimidoylglutamate deiminase
MTQLFAHKALLPDGWADQVRLEIAGGRIVDVSCGKEPGDSDGMAACIIPGLGNAHSHAFQRALAGRTEQRSPALLHAIAKQAYTEMLESGYTSVAEFHYLHRDPSSGDAGIAMFDALSSAAAECGIRMCYVPVLYERAGFDSPEPAGHQAYFALDVEAFLAHHEEAGAQQTARLTIGIGAHSLRAVSQLSLNEIAQAAGSGPIHLHIAEQQREVDQCMGAHERRPVRWLMENFDVDRRWCLVHATHMDYDETRSLATSGAVVCICPSTEANLGDGLFPLEDFLREGGNIAIGSDSHVSINPFEELRWLEYGQRLVTHTRNIASLRSPHVGRELFDRAVEGGAQACGQELAGLAPGAPADLIALYDEDPMLTGHGHDSRLDALVFSGYRLPIDGVMVHGEWQVISGFHKCRDETRETYRKAIGAIGAGE